MGWTILPPTMIQDIETAVTGNHPLGNGVFLLEFSHGDLAGSLSAGQFVMVGMPGTGIFLRRPFSVCGLPGTFSDSPPDAVQILYKVTGRGTAVLSGLAPGAALTVLGPLGNGFPLPAGGRIPLLIAGGIGSAPFPALAAAMTSAGRKQPILFYGGRSENDLPLLDWFQDRCETVHTATEDGSAGDKGFVTEPLLRRLDDWKASDLEMFACGPEPMLRAIRDLAVPREIRCHVSLEAHMACGFGVCIGCVVPTWNENGSREYTRICVDGPVLPAEKLAW